MKVVIVKRKPLIQIRIVAETSEERDILFDIWESEGLKAIERDLYNSWMLLEEGQFGRRCYC